MKRFIVAAFIALAAMLVPASLFAQKGESAFGVQTGYTSTNQSAIIGLFYQYQLSDIVRLSPEVGCVLRHKNEDAFTFDLNVHFPIGLKQTNMELYPIAGVSYASWHTITPVLDDDDVSNRLSRFGVNLGAGYQYDASSTLKLKIEAKYNLTKKFSSAIIAVGIGYRF